MLKMLGIVCCVFGLSTLTTAQIITNCQSFRSCSARPTVSGSNVDFSYYQCGGLCCGGGFSSCSNGGSGDCPSHGCESRCNGVAPNFTGFTHTYYDCEDTLHIDTTQCSGCKATPTPTPTPCPTPNTPKPSQNCSWDTQYCTWNCD